MSQETAGISVILYFPSGQTSFGTMHYLKEGLIVHSNSGKINDLSGISFGVKDTHRRAISESERTSGLLLQSEDRVDICPFLIKHVDYSPEPRVHERMYPPSTEGWMNHVDVGSNATVFVHKILNRNRHFLVIAGTDGTILGALVVHAYEIGPLLFTEDWAAYQDIIKASSDERNTSLDEILLQPPPDWWKLSKLIEGVTIPNLRLGRNMRETMDQLVPQSFPEEVRREVTAFLAWLCNVSLPKEDPVEFTMRNVSMPVFHTLVNGHVRCLLDSLKPPNYVKIMAMADQGMLELPRQTISETQSHNPWYNSWITLRDTSPDWTGRVIEFANSLTGKAQPVTQLPISRSEAARSRKAWGDRFAMTTHGLHMRAQVHPESIGLKTVIYRGAAYTWPHKHLAWSARLGFQKNRNDIIQIMALPPPAIERVQRLMKNASPVEWESSGTNLRLYNKNSKRWSLIVKRIVNSLKGARRISQLESEFGTEFDKVVRVTTKQAKILDMVSWGVYLASLETGWYSRYYGIANQEFREIVMALQKQGVITLRYLPVLTRMVSFCVEANGPGERICSLARSMRLHTPSATVMIAEDGELCYGFLRIPEESAYDFVTMLPIAGNDLEMNIRCWPISLYSGYLSNLYQRILNDDGSWNEDISMLLSQKRDD